MRYTYDKMTFRELKEGLEEVGMTIADFQRITGLPDVVISRWEGSDETSAWVWTWLELARDPDMRGSAASVTGGAMDWEPFMAALDWIGLNRWDFCRMTGTDMRRLERSKAGTAALPSWVKSWIVMVGKKGGLNLCRDVMGEVLRADKEKPGRVYPYRRLTA